MFTCRAKIQSENRISLFPEPWRSVTVGSSPREGLDWFLEEPNMWNFKRNNFKAASMALRESLGSKA